MIHLAQSLHFIDWALWPKKGSNLQLPSEQGSIWLSPVLFPRQPHSCNGRTTSDSKKGHLKSWLKGKSLPKPLHNSNNSTNSNKRMGRPQTSVLATLSDWCIHVALSLLQPGLCAFLAFWNLLLELVSFPPQHFRSKSPSSEDSLPSGNSSGFIQSWMGRTKQVIKWKSTISYAGSTMRGVRLCQDWVSLVAHELALNTSPK